MADAWRMKVADVRITSGASDFRIYQQDDAGRADIEVGGTFDEQPGGRDHRVLVRLLSEQDFSPLAPAARWTPAETVGRGSWSHVLRGVPAGGLYQIQTSLNWRNPDGVETGRLTSSVHHLGVGDLWILAGQSNASGTGRGQADDPPELGVHVLANDERWHLAVHPLNEPRGTDHPNRDAGPGTSPYLKFAKLLHRSLGYPIGLVQTAMGGSSLRMWHIEEDPAAPLWHNMVHCVRLAGGRARGLAWYQGCSDAGLAGDKDSCAYERRWARFIELVRREFGDLPVVTVQLNRWMDVARSPDLPRGWTIMREVQRRLATTVPGVCVVPALDIPLSDGIHSSSTGNAILGERLARAALGFVYGRPLPWKAPNIRSAARDPSGKTVTLTFDDVTSRLIFLGFGRADFTVEDSLGRAEVAATRCDGAAVHLDLSRPLEGRAVVHGADGVDPEWTLRDYDTGLPPLAFADLEVE